MPVTITCKGLPSWPKEPVTIIIEQGWTIAETLELAGITKKKHGIMAIVNGKLCLLSTQLNSHDNLTIYPRMGGG
ncbi:hypothetical protein [Halodesulfovibrio sp. MK-HDV]|uniref:hypothetical protein n=1 Tax=Halodesulfovibrio sp. MK-HDV TaxID=2599925 RepID=UPI0013700A5D|nr:hypothetical protein [Halodesulfovibrio sp. MK-HDV]KAF1077861.1 hypothetical protein MKHDV_00321 [Halodesulfovibrio sp. MK-HDV]